MVNLLSIMITSTGLIYSIYLLMSRKYNTKSPVCNSCICLYGIGWMFLLLQTIKNPFELPLVVGLAFLLIGFFVWSNKQLLEKDSILSLLK